LSSPTLGRPDLHTKLIPDYLLGELKLGALAARPEPEPTSDI